MGNIPICQPKVVDYPGFSATNVASFARRCIEGHGDLVTTALHECPAPLMKLILIGIIHPKVLGFFFLFFSVMCRFPIRIVMPSSSWPVFSSRMASMIKVFFPKIL